MKRFVLGLQLCLLIAVIALLNNCARTPSALPKQIIPTPSTQRIALLLPLTGQYEPYAKAIKNGFFTAFYQKKKEKGVEIDIFVLDTNGKNIQTVYQQAVSQGANFIVGPLDKESVAVLANSDVVKVPVLALNTTPKDEISNSALFEFALSPTDEAKQAADKAWQDNRRNIIVIAPDDAWGKRLADAFITQWKALGGHVIGKQTYTTITELAGNMRDILGITQAYTNQHQLKNILKTNMRFIPERRQDFDGIFLVASPKMASQIQPLLKFYFAGDVPVYATSEIYTNTSQAPHNKDLDGILFCDMPWTLTPNQLTPDYLNKIQTQIQTLWPKTYAEQAKFYAFGVDAFYLTTMLNQLQPDATAGLRGETGVLCVT